MKQNESRGYESPYFETTAVNPEIGFCASSETTLNGFNDPESIDFDFNDENIHRDEKEYILYDMRCGCSAGSRVMFG